MMPTSRPGTCRAADPEPGLGRYPIHGLRLSGLRGRAGGLSFGRPVSLSPGRSAPSAGRRSAWPSAGPKARPAVLQTKEAALVAKEACLGNFCAAQKASKQQAHPLKFNLGFQTH